MISEIDIELNGFKLAALHANNARATTNPQRILCLHGWLDNANSFKPLLPLLDNAEVVALDLPGHGRSDHQNAIYSIAPLAHTVLSAATALGWDNFTLLGHSLGGCIAPFATVAAENRVEKLIIIDAAGPMSEAASELPLRLKKFHSEMTKNQQYASRIFESIDQAVASRLRANKMKPESARLIVERQLEETGFNGQYKWRFDGLLRVSSPSYFTEEQVQSVLSSVTCPTLCILAENGYVKKREDTKNRLAKLKHCTTVTLAGHHHVHLDNPESVAREINQFLSE